MLAEPRLQRSRHGFPVRDRERLERRVGQAHARAAPLSARLLITPVIIRAIGAPTVEGLGAATAATERVLARGIEIYSQTVHGNFHSPGFCSPGSAIFSRARSSIVKGT